jgi:hypothetical protein
MPDVPTEAERAALVACLGDLVGYLTKPEIVEVKSLLEALARHHVQAKLGAPQGRTTDERNTTTS